jgi:hypothetical protein
MVGVNRPATIMGGSPCFMSILSRDPRQVTRYPVRSQSKQTSAPGINLATALAHGYDWSTTLPHEAIVLLDPASTRKRMRPAGSEEWRLILSIQKRSPLGRQRPRLPGDGTEHRVCLVNQPIAYCVCRLDVGGSPECAQHWTRLGWHAV